MGQPKPCDKLCTVEVDPQQATFINSRIRENYVVNWLIDGLPVGYVRRVGAGDTQDDRTSIGFPLGVDVGRETPKLNNHYEISIEFHKNEQKKTLRVVGVTVEPYR